MTGKLIMGWDLPFNQVIRFRTITKPAQTSNLFKEAIFLFENYFAKRYTEPFNFEHIWTSTASNQTTYQ